MKTGSHVPTATKKEREKMKNKQLEEATAYFEQIDQIIRQFREERTLITNQIRDIAETDGWDSTECARLREYEARMRFPVSSGTNKAWLPTGLYRMEYINDAKDETMVAAIVKLGIRFEYRSVDN